MLAHASLIVLFMQSGLARGFADRLVAVGRMAFSNYIAVSILCVLLFHGYGRGFFGLLDRWQVYLLVPPIWAALLLWSKPWLERYACGPLEWLWRALTRVQRPAANRPAVDAPP